MLQDINEGLDDDGVDGSQDMEEGLAAGNAVGYTRTRTLISATCTHISARPPPKYMLPLPSHTQPSGREHLGKTQAQKAPFGGVKSLFENLALQ